MEGVIVPTSDPLEDEDLRARLVQRAADSPVSGWLGAEGDGDEEKEEEEDAGGGAGAGAGRRRSNARVPASSAKQQHHEYGGLDGGLSAHSACGLEEANACMAVPCWLDRGSW